MSFKLKTVAALWAASLGAAGAQPTACTEDLQCNTGFYCEERARYCRECVSCAELRREPPPEPVACVKSVVQCGPCLEGLEDLRLGSGCVAPAPAAGAETPAYIWALIGFAVALCIGLIAFFVAVIRRKGNIMHMLKIRATVTPRTPQPPSAPAGPPAEEPPPYDHLYRAASPDPALVEPYYLQEDASQPFIKPGAPPAHGAREAAGRQAAQPFNNPAYIRGPPSAAASSDSAPGSPFPPPDDDTLESPWTPEPFSANGANNAIAFPSAEEAAAPGPLRRRAEPEPGPPSKALCLRRQDSASSIEPEERAGGAGAAVTVVINNVTNVSLPRL